MRLIPAILIGIYIYADFSGYRGGLAPSFAGFAANLLGYLSENRTAFMLFVLFLISAIATSIALAYRVMLKRIWNI